MPTEKKATQNNRPGNPTQKPQSFFSVRIAGIELPVQKKIEYALRYVYGIGPTTASKILEKVNVEVGKRTKDLTDLEINKIRAEVESGSYLIEGELRQKIFQDIKRLKDIRSYKGIRHKIGLPARGQRTRHNAHTRKGKSIAIGGLKRKVEKK